MLREHAHLAVTLGDVARARALIAAVEVEAPGASRDAWLVLQLEGLLELSLGDAASALPPLRAAREIAERLEIGEPWMLTFLLDEVEAHALVGDVASAAAVLMTFDRRCVGVQPGWIVPLVLRARGLVEASAGDLATARATLEAAVAAEGELPLPLERARARLTLGRVLRMLGERSRAEAELAEAVKRFEEHAALLWADRAREELRHVGDPACLRTTPWLRQQPGTDPTQAEQSVGVPRFRSETESRTLAFSAEPPPRTPGDSPHPTPSESCADSTISPDRRRDNDR